MPPLRKDDAAELIKQRHGEWKEFQRRWRWLQDSYEGGNRYRHADYVTDPFIDLPALPWYSSGIDPQTSEINRHRWNQITNSNLIPHLSETSEHGSDVYAQRLARTPVPTLVRRAVTKHLSRVYAHEVRRDGPPELVRWWADCDGAGTPVDKWVRKQVAPLLLVVGHIDLVFDRPALPEGVAAASVRTKADERRLGLDGCVASYILPENLVWWRLDHRRRYLEVLCYERWDGRPGWRHWTDDESNFYLPDGTSVPGRSRAHGLGFVPVRRFFDDRKLRCQNTGQSRYESIAELQKAVYNRNSERHLSDVQQSHAILQGPEELLSDDANITIGPNGLAPMKRKENGDYQGLEYVDPPKGAQDSLRTNVLDDLDEADREACLLKPAGAAHGSGKTVAQSGVSKSYDHQDLNDLLGELAQTLAELELGAAELAYGVLKGGDPDEAALDSIEVSYPREFDLYTANDMADVSSDLQSMGESAGVFPEAEKEAAKRYVARAFPGLPDDRLKELHDEIDGVIDAAAGRRSESREGSQLRAEQFAVTDAAPLTGPMGSLITSPEPA